MAYVTVPKDLSRVKTKVLFNLTKRQLVCFGGGALIGVPLFFLLKGQAGTSVAALCMVLVMLPFFLLGVYEKNGQPLEKLIGNLLQVSVLRPKQRPYKTNNFYAVVERQADLDREVHGIIRGKGKKGKQKRRLTREEKKQIEAAIARANRTDKKEKSAQDSIPFEQMWPNGVCRLPDGRYSKTIQFQDINYQLSQNEDKTAIFEQWSEFLNYFDSSIRFQLSFLNLVASRETFANSVQIPMQGDDFDPIRAEYSQMLQTQLERGNNGLVKTKYLTFSVAADSSRQRCPGWSASRQTFSTTSNALAWWQGPWTGGNAWPSCTPSSTWTSRCRFSLSGTGWPRPGCRSRISLRPVRLGSATGKCSAWAGSTGLSASCRFWPRS